MTTSLLAGSAPSDRLRTVQLDPQTSWRALEDEVRADVTRVADWLPAWAATHRPSMKPTSARYAITWRWIHDAGGLLDTSPAWGKPATRRQKAAYRQFAAAVDQDQAAVIEAVGRQSTAVRAIVSQVGRNKAPVGSNAGEVGMVDDAGRHRDEGHAS